MRKPYPTDLSDAEWNYIEPHMPPSEGHGRPRIHSLREILNAIFYLLKSGCQWRLLPHDFPRWPTVYHYFRKWRIDGTWERINRAIRELLRVRLKRDPRPSAGIVDSQSVKTTGVGGEERGYDGGKKVKGRKRMQCGPLDVFAFDRHLYRPLVHLTNADEGEAGRAERGEQRFVRNLKDFHDLNSDYFADKELYLLRNMSRGKGIGFFEAGNFYPDFVMWLTEENGDKQYVTFIDPKGIRRLDGVEDPKIRFHETIKGIEARLGAPSIVLASFIVSNTPHAQLTDWGVSKNELEDRHVLFQNDDPDTYIEKMLDLTVLQESADH